MASGPSDDRHLAGEEHRIANDEVVYTFQEFLDYGQRHATVKWNSTDVHRAGEVHRIAYDGCASDVHDAVLVAGFLPPVGSPPVAAAGSSRHVVNPLSISADLHRTESGPFEGAADAAKLAEALGEMLATRMQNNIWAEPPWEQIPQEWKDKAAVGYSEAEKLRAQAKLKIKRGKTVTERKCAFCSSTINTAGKHRCARCLDTRYCSRECQGLHWPDHKATCAPPAAKVVAHTAIALPEHECTVMYMNWFKNNVVHPTVGIMIMNRQTFLREFGQEQYRKTLLTLALSGRPDFNMVSICGAAG